MMRRLNVYLSWLCVSLFAYPVLWKAFDSSLPFVIGVRGLTDLWIGIPVLFVAIAGAVVLSVLRFHKVETLFFWTGVLFTVSCALLIYVSNSGGIALSGLATLLAQRGKELLAEREMRLNS